MLHVGHVERFNGAVQELRKIVERPILIESRRLGPFVPRVQNDSVVMDLMIHDIDIVLGLVDGEPRKITAVGRLGALAGRPTSPPCRSSSTRGAMATITASRATEEKIRTLAITQPDAYIVLDYSTRTSRSTGAPRRSTRSTASPSATGRPPSSSTCFVHKDNPLKLEIRHLISAARAADGDRAAWSCPRRTTSGRWPSRWRSSG